MNFQDGGDGFDFYFTLVDSGGEQTAYPGTLELRIYDDFDKTLLNTTRDIDENDFEWYETILGVPVLAYARHIAYNQCQKSDSRGYSLNADISFSLGDKVLSLENEYVPYPDELEAPNKPPVLIVYGPSYGWSGLYAEFDASQSYDPNGDLYLDFYWEFGDGTTSSYGETQSHKYDRAGDYQVNITVEDDEGGIDTVSHIVSITNPDPIIIIDPPIQCWVETWIEFDASESYDPNDNYLYYHWEFGDGDTNTYSSSPTHYYDKGGVYQVNLTIEDHEGGSNRTSFSITIMDPEVISINDCGIWNGGPFDYYNGYFFVNITLTNQAPFQIDIWSYGWDVITEDGVIFGVYTHKGTVPDGLLPGASSSWILLFDIEDDKTPVKLIYDERVEVLI